MAAGLPVAATDVGGVASVVEAGVTGTLVPAGDPPALAAVLGAYVADGISAASARQRWTRARRRTIQFAHDGVCVCRTVRRPVGTADVLPCNHGVRAPP